MTAKFRVGFSSVTTAFGVALWLGGCTPPPRTASATVPATATVVARGETAAVATVDADAADDPAIWRDPVNPARSLIVGTDKKAGLNVYGLDGRLRSAVPSGRVNNVDLIEARIAGRRGVLVAASDRNDPLSAKVVLYRLDTRAGRLELLGHVAAGSGEGYGLCLTARAGGIDAFMVLKDGTIHQIALDLAGAPSGRIVRTMKLATQSEGCVVDPRTNTLYVAEEDAGIWRFDSRPDGPTTAIGVARADTKTLVADVEGLTLAPVGRSGGWLIASSQGDNAYSLYRLRDGSFAGRFRIAAGSFGATSETDGIALLLGRFPGYPGGLFVAQDGDNLPAAQNFKLVAWDDVRRALQLRD